MKKNVLITGATKGIGLAISNKLNSTGWNVIGIARNKIHPFPGDIFVCDLSNRQRTNSILKAITDKYSISAVINNVGIAIPEPIEAVDLNNIDLVYDLNVRVAVQITQKCAQQMRSRKWG